MNATAPAPAALRFIYRNGAGEVAERELSHWAEAGHYLKGHDTTKGRVLTFRKDRVVEYLDGGADLLTAPRGLTPPKPARDAAPDARPQMLFTGFGKAEREALEAQAEAAGLRVVQTVTNGLSFLVCGGNAGPSKVEKARDQGVYIVAAEHLQALLETGELADETVDAL